MEDESGTHISKRRRTASSAEGLNHVVKLKGLPWDCRVETIISFLDFSDGHVQPEAVRMIFNQQGEAFVRLASEDDATACLRHDRRSMGRRYIEVFRFVLCCLPLACLSKPHRNHDMMT